MFLKNFCPTALALFISCVVPCGLQAEDFEPFTAMVTKSRVRMRTKADLDSTIVRELSQGDLFIVDGEEQGFYRVIPDRESTAFIYRSYVLDDMVEGHHVNVRLEPKMEATVLCQLSSGDRVKGHVAEENPKWLEIAMPEAVRFYVAADYMTRVGDVNYLPDRQQKLEHIQGKMMDAYVRAKALIGKEELDCDIQEELQILYDVVEEAKEFEDEREQAELLVQELDRLLLEMRLSLLEKQKRDLSRELSEKKSPALIQGQERSSLVALPKPVEVDPFFMEQEEEIFHRWLEKFPGNDRVAFALYEKKRAIHLHGVIERYLRKAHRRPGDYLLIDSSTKQPLAFLYSSTVDLEPFVGRDARIACVPRPNHHYAQGAYRVLEVEAP